MQPTTTIMMRDQVPHAHDAHPVIRALFERAQRTLQRLLQRCSQRLAPALPMLAVALLTGCSPSSSNGDTAGNANAPAGTHWVQCANERGTCQFNGPTSVKYGTPSQYVVLPLRDGTPCNNAVFGDPAPGSEKQCWRAADSSDSGGSGAAAAGTTGSAAATSNAANGSGGANTSTSVVWTRCAAEHGTCAFDGTRQVRYGSETQYVELTRKDGTPCDNGVFGDPAPGTEKSCWYGRDNDRPSADQASTETAAAFATANALSCRAPSQPVNAGPIGDMIEADTPGGDGTRMFRSGQLFKMTITTRAERNDTLAWQIVDTWNTVRASGQFAVAPGPQTVTLNCVSTMSGYFAISATLAASGNALPARGTRPAGVATFGVLPDLTTVLPAAHFANEDQHRFGGQGSAFVAPGQKCCDGDGYRPLYTDLGLWWVNDNRNWYKMEPNGPDTFKPATQTLSPWFRKGDLMRLIQLDGLPAWASPDGKETHSYAPKAFGDYQDYMTRVGVDSDAVRKKVFPNQANNYYQVTWEPDYDSGLPWKDTDENLVALYQATWNGIHAGDPNAVVMGVTNAAVSTNAEWLKRLAPLGIGKYLDGVTIHGYYDVGTSPSHPPERLANSDDPAQSAKSLPAQMRALRQQMASMLKPGAKLFVTETGISYDIGSQYGPNYPTPNILFAHGAVAARTQLILLGEGADTSFVFYATDFPKEIGYGLFFDLVDPQGAFGPSSISPKPAAMAMAAMTRLIDGTDTIGPLTQTPKGVFGYTFQRYDNGPVITALWAHDNAQWNARSGFSTTWAVDYKLNVDAPGTSGQVTLVDMMGNSTSANYSDGAVALKLTESPVYVISNNATVAKAQSTLPAGYVAR